MLGLDGDAVSRKNFILPTLGSKLEKAARAVYQGRGFVIVRGLDTASHSIEDSVTTFLGIASYIGDQRGLQDRRGNMLCRPHHPQWFVDASALNRLRSSPWINHSSRHKLPALENSSLPASWHPHKHGSSMKILNPVVSCLVGMAGH